MCSGGQGNERPTVKRRLRLRVEKLEDKIPSAEGLEYFFESHQLEGSTIRFELKMLACTRYSTSGLPLFTSDDQG